MQQFFYRFLEDGTYCVTEYQGDEADVIIPDTYCSKPVTVLFDRLFKGHTEITSVKIPDTVTDIGSFVFDGCTSLTTVTGINKLEYISSDVFRGTPWLEDLPDGLLYLGKVLFMYKGTMPDNTTINIKEGTTQIAYRALFECKGLVGLSIPESLTTIESGNFYENNLIRTN